MLCTLFGVTRQAYYEAPIHESKTSIAHMIVLTLVNDLRNDIPIIGTRKLLFILAAEFKKHNIKMGRDQLFDLLRFHGLLMRRRKRMTKTTDSHHWLKKYPNLINSTLPSYDESLFFNNCILRCSCRLFICSITSFWFIPFRGYTFNMISLTS